MQKIFYNAKFYTLNDKLENVEAMLVNDENIVLAGTKDEIFDLKTNETEMIDLKEKFVIPASFGTFFSAYKIIEEKLKNANLLNFIEKIDEKDEDFEKFVNFDVYLREFKIIQEKLIQNGITTIQEMNLNHASFTFFKKLAESGNLKIDIIGYVNIISSKDVMDNNCKSFRKYRNHFRLGGYSLNLDGDVLSNRAWISKSYKHSKSFGAGSIYAEHLKFVIKTAIEERKQLVVVANGDRALDLYLEIAEEVFSEKKDDEKYLPIVAKADFANLKQLKKMKELGMAVNFDLDLAKNHYDELKQKMRRSYLKNIIKTKSAKNIGVDILFNQNDNYLENIFGHVEFISERTSSGGKKVNKSESVEPEQGILAGTKTASKLCFDGEFKGTLENGKRANFLVLSADPFLCPANELKNIKIEQVYNDGNLLFDSMKSEKLNEEKI